MAEELAPKSLSHPPRLPPLLTQGTHTLAWGKAGASARSINTMCTRAAQRPLLAT